MSAVKYQQNNVNMQKKGLILDNRDRLVLIVCSLSIFLSVIGTLITHYFFGKNGLLYFVPLFNFAFILLWIISIIVEKNTKSLHQWLNKK